MTTRTLKTKVFPGAQNLPLYVGREQGCFERHGINLDLRFTRDSSELRRELASGEIDIAHTAVDNAVAMREAGHDIAVFMGGDSSMNEFFVQSRIAHFGALRGETLIVDAPDTAYALQAEQILANHGLKAHADYTLLSVGATYRREQAMADDPGLAAAILNPPYSLRGQARGLRSLGRVIDLLGNYQATGAFAMRVWAADHPDLIENYICAYIEALRWLRDPVHAETCVALLASHLEIDDALAADTYALLLDPSFGLTPDAALDAEGFMNVLKLRKTLGHTLHGGELELARYADLSYYDTALNRLDASIASPTAAARNLGAQA